MRKNICHGQSERRRMKTVVSHNCILGIFCYCIVLCFRCMYVCMYVCSVLCMLVVMVCIGVSVGWTSVCLVESFV